MLHKYLILTAHALCLLPLLTAQADVLLLAHFDEPRLSADYSAGGMTEGSAGNGARGGVPGFFEGATDLGYHTPPGASLTFPAREPSLLGLVRRRPWGSA